MLGEMAQLVRGMGTLICSPELACEELVQWVTSGALLAEEGDIETRRFCSASAAEPVTSSFSERLSRKTQGGSDHGGHQTLDDGLSLCAHCHMNMGHIQRQKVPGSSRNHIREE